jgi:hypothetical protein
MPGQGLRVVRRPPGHCPGYAGTGVANYRPAPRPAVNEELADQLLGQAPAEGGELLGPHGPEWP